MQSFYVLIAGLGFLAIIRVQSHFRAFGLLRIVLFELHFKRCRVLVVVDVGRNSAEEVHGSSDHPEMHGETGLCPEVFSGHQRLQREEDRDGIQSSDFVQPKFMNE